MSNLAVNAQGLISVAIYDTLSPESLSFIVNHGSMTVLMVTSTLIDKVVEIQNECPNLKKIVILEENVTDVSDIRNKLPNYEILRFMDLVDAGSSDAKFDKLLKSDVAQIMYTSGTTGNPKGVMITNGNMVAEIAALRHLEMVFEVHVKPGMRTLSYLPNAHIFAQALEITFLSIGVCTYFSSVS